MSPGRLRASTVSAVLWGCLGTALVLACGARAGAGPDELEPETATGAGGTSTLNGSGGTVAAPSASGGTSSSVGGGTSSGAGGAGGSSGNPPFQFETHELPPCSPGFQPSAANGRSCKYRFDDLCYEDESSVCACACPRAGNSSCVLSGFLGDPNQPLQVRCDAS